MAPDAHVGIGPPAQATRVATTAAPTCPQATRRRRRHPCPQATSSKKSISCTTEPLSQLNLRCREMIGQILLTTEKVHAWYRLV